MDIKHYEKMRDMILFDRVQDPFSSYISLMVVFVQDCYMPIHQPYFGNVTKQKAKILFDLFPYMEKRFMK